MKIIVLISILTLIRAEDYQGNYIINGVPHREILLKTLPSQFNFRNSPLAIDYKTNDLYFDWYDTSGISVLNINTKEHKHITGLWSPQCVTVDQDTNNVYIGTVDGIYKYNGTAQLELVGAKGEDVWRIYHHNGVIYYRKYAKHKEINTLVKGQFVTINIFNLDVQIFVVDNEENIVYTTNNGSLYRHKINTNQNVLYEGIPDVQSLTTDRNGKVYFSVDDGIYMVKGDVVEKIVNMSNPKYIAFDGDNNIIYYNDKDSNLYKLKPANVTHSGSEPHINDKENDAIKDDNIVISKIDDLAQIILTLQAKVDKLQSDVQQLRAAEERHDVESSPRWIRLETGNIPICRGEAGVGQVFP